MVAWPGAALAGLERTYVSLSGVVDVSGGCQRRDLVRLWCGGSGAVQVPAEYPAALRKELVHRGAVPVSPGLILSFFHVAPPPVGSECLACVVDFM